MKDIAKEKVSYVDVPDDGDYVIWIESEKPLKFLMLFSLLNKGAEVVSTPLIRSNRSSLASTPSESMTELSAVDKGETASLIINEPNNINLSEYYSECIEEADFELISVGGGVEGRQLWIKAGTRVELRTPTNHMNKIFKSDKENEEKLKQMKEAHKLERVSLKEINDFEDQRKKLLREKRLSFSKRIISIKEPLNIRWGLIKRRPRKENFDCLHKVNSKQSYFCILCRDGFSSIDSLTQHMKDKMHSGDPKWNHIFYEKMKNFTLFVQSKPIPIENINITFHTEKQVSDNKNKHESKVIVSENDGKATTTEPNYTCTKCNKKFNFLSTLQNHLKQKKHFSCDKCKRKFATNFGVQQHSISKHPMVDGLEGAYYGGHSRVEFCTICMKHTNKDHIKSKNQTNHFLCPICLVRVFKMSSSLKKHIADSHGNGFKNEKKKQINQVSFGHKTTLAIVPDEKVWEPIQTIRAQHDRQFIRWMPHINIVYPFVSKEHFESFKKILSEKLSYSPFELELSSFSYFEQKTESVVYLQPNKKSHSEKLRILYSTISDILRNNGFTEQKQSFTPHLTVAQVPTQNAQEFVAKLNESWKPISFVVKDLKMMSRGEDTPFVIEQAIPLVTKETDFVGKKKNKNLKPYFSKKRLGELAKISVMCRAWREEPAGPMDKITVEQAYAKYIDGKYARGLKRWKYKTMKKNYLLVLKDQKRKKQEEKSRERTERRLRRKWAFYKKQK